MNLRRRSRPSLAAASLLFLGPWLSPSGGQLMGPEFQVNSYTPDAQRTPDVAVDASGNFVVVWISANQDGSNFGVFGQRFNSAGAMVGSEFQINSYTTNEQSNPAVAADSSGNFVATWESFGQDGSNGGVFAQRFNSAGAQIGSEFQVNTVSAGYQERPAVAVDGTARFVIAWEGSGYGGFDVFGQRYDSAGNPAGNEFQVNSYSTGYQLDPGVAVDGLDNFVVVWGEEPSQDGSSYSVFGQRYNSAGSPVGAEFQINSFTTGSQRHPAVAADGAGNFVVVWESDLQDGSGWGVFGQRFSGAGSAVGGEFQVNSYTTGHQNYPKVAADRSGRFVVAWQSNGQDGSGPGVFGQRFDSVGARVGPEFQINSFTTDNQTGVDVAADGSGNFVVAWQSMSQDGSNDGVFGRLLNTVIFHDGFELGDGCAWSAAVGGGC